MIEDAEVKYVAEKIARWMWENNLDKKNWVPDVDQYVEQFHGFYGELAQDIVVALLGDEYPLDGVVDHAKNGNGCVPVAVCGDGERTGEC